MQNLKSGKGKRKNSQKTKEKKKKRTKRAYLFIFFLFFYFPKKKLGECLSSLPLSSFLFALEATLKTEKEEKNSASLVHWLLF